MQLTTIVH